MLALQQEQEEQPQAGPQEDQDQEQEEQPPAEQQEDQEEEPQEMEIEEEQPEQEAGAEGAAAGGDHDDDDEEDPKEDDSDEDDDEEVQQPPPVPRWTVTRYVRDGGHGFYHRRLVRMLRDRYGSGNAGVEYRSEEWTHPHHRTFWRTAVHVRTTDSLARAAREESVHRAITARDSQAAGIADAARQAYSVYHSRHFNSRRFGFERYYPRRRSGETAYSIASTAHIEDPQFASTVALVGALNTELEAYGEENRLLRAQLAEMQTRVATLEHQAGLAPAPRSPVYRGESPPRQRARYGTAAASTTVDP